MSQSHMSQSHCAENGDLRCRKKGLSACRFLLASPEVRTFAFGFESNLTHTGKPSNAGRDAFGRPAHRVTETGAHASE